MRMLILGGYGGLGAAIARLLARKTECEIVVAGRSREKAETVAAALKEAHPGRKITGRGLDARKRNDLVNSLRGMDAALVCVPVAVPSEGIAIAAAEAGVDCVDMRYPQEAARRCLAFHRWFQEMNRCCLIQAGHLPGLASALMRYAATRLPRMRGVTLSTAMRIARINESGAAQEMVDIARDMKPELYRDGRWQSQSIFRARRIEFDAGFGAQLCIPVRMEEMTDLAGQLGLRDAALYVAGVNPFVDAFVMPAIMLTRHLRTRWTTELLGRLLAWGVRAFARPPYGAVFSMEARAENGGMLRLDISAPGKDSYEFAAIALLAGLFQYLDGSIRKAGVRFMGHEVDPERLLRDMEQLGAEIRRRESAA